MVGKLPRGKKPRGNAGVGTSGREEVPVTVYTYYNTGCHSTSFTSKDERDIFFLHIFESMSIYSYRTTLLSKSKLVIFTKGSYSFT